MNHISKLTSVHVNIFSEMSALASKHNAINLGQGFPDYDPPSELLKLVDVYTHDHKNQYAPMAGLLQLRETISEKIYTLYGKYLDPEHEITITAGATQAIFTIISAFVHRDDEVIIFEPAYDSYRPSVEIAGGKCVVYTMYPPDFSINWNVVKALVTAKTKMIIINSPHNPTGRILLDSDLKALAEIVKDTDIIILSDEVYEHLIYDGMLHESVFRHAELFSRSLSVFSFGKTFHATGWKVGYVAGPKYLMQEFRNVHQWNVFCVNSFVQYALSDFLLNKGYYMELSIFYQKKRDYFLQIISNTAFKPLRCAGTYFQVVAYEAVSDLDDKTFCTLMPEKYGIAAIPLSAFYTSEDDIKLIRFCFAKTENLLDQAAERLMKIK
jgi:methionine aminotransferase